LTITFKPEGSRLYYEEYSGYSPQTDYKTFKTNNQPDDLGLGLLGIQSLRTGGWQV
jgi:hypothetical protein